MIEPRLAAEVRIAAIRKIAQHAGGFATVLRKGDAVSGAILLVALQRGKDPRVFEAMPLLDGGSEWQKVWPQASGKYKELSDYLENRMRFDPDIWVLELDIADAEQLIAQIGQQG